MRISTSNRIPSPFRDLAEAYIQAGFSPIPIKAGTKKPGCRGWDGGGWARYCKNHATGDFLAKWFRDPCAGIGLCCGYNGLIGLDVDDERAYDAVRAVFKGRGAPVKAGRHGMTALFFDRSGEIKGRKFQRRDGKGNVFEILSRGQQTVIPPTIHPESGREYLWLRRKYRGNIILCDLPVITSGDIEDLLDRVDSLIKKQNVITKRFCEKVDPSEKFDAETIRRYKSVAGYELSTRCLELNRKSKPGRDDFLFRSSCLLGRWVHHGMLEESTMILALLGACDSNGLLRDNGRRSCLGSIGRGIAYSVNDALPTLMERARPKW